MAVDRTKTTRYRPAQARPQTLEELRQYVWQELQHIGNALNLTDDGHLLYSSKIHKDVDDTQPIALRDGLFWNGEYFVPDRRTRFLPNGYISGQEYQRGDEVANGVQISECIVDGATEYPYIVPEGDPEYIYFGTQTNTTVTAKQVLFGTRYTTGLDGFLTGYRLYLFAGFNYTIYTVRDPEDEAPIFDRGLTATPSEDGWQSFSTAPQLILAGALFDVIVYVDAKDVEPITLTFNYNYTTPQNPGNPANGVIIHPVSSPSTMQIAYVDHDGSDRRAALDSLKEGDGISGWGSFWTIQGITPGTTFVEFIVTPAVVSVDEGVAPFDFENVPPLPIPYGYDTDWWATPHYPNISGRGLFIYDGGWDHIVPDDNHYGIDIQVQTAYVPQQWRVKIYAEGGGGGGATGTTIRPKVIYTALETYNVTATDENALIVTTSDNPVTVVVPDETGALPVGFICHFHQNGLGQVTIDKAAGVSLVSSRSLVTRAQHSSLSLFKLNANYYSVVGDQE